MGQVNSLIHKVTSAPDHLVKRETITLSQMSLQEVKIAYSSDDYANYDS